MSFRTWAGMALIAATTLVTGCATSRSEVHLRTTPTAGATAPRADAPLVVIRSVTDERVFEDAPGDPATPSLGGEGASKSSADVKARAVGRKRNGFGKAMGDILLAPGETVTGTVRENVALAFREAGYRVAAPGQNDPAAITVDVHVKRFWSWLVPGAWLVGINASIETTLDIAPPAGMPDRIVVDFKDNRGAVTEGVWVDSIEQALAAYRKQLGTKLPRG